MHFPLRKNVNCSCNRDGRASSTSVDLWEKKVCKQNLRTKLQNKILVLIYRCPFPLPKNFVLILHQPDCKPGLILVAVHVENPTLVPRALLVRPAQHKPWARLKWSFIYVFASWPTKPWWQFLTGFRVMSGKGNWGAIVAFLSFLKRENLQTWGVVFLFIYILFFSEEKVPKPEEPRAHKLTKCKTKSLDIWRTTVSEKLMSAFMIRIVRQNAPDTVTNPGKVSKKTFFWDFIPNYG